MTEEDSQKIKHRAVDDGVSASELVRRWVATLVVIAVVAGAFWLWVGDKKDTVVAPASLEQVDEVMP